MSQFAIFYPSYALLIIILLSYISSGYSKFTGFSTTTDNELIASNFFFSHLASALFIVLSSTHLLKYPSIINPNTRACCWSTGIFIADSLVVNVQSAIFLTPVNLILSTNQAVLNAGAMK
tara:strand:+ start:72 stop:431 length:360 start_codon:yes stop_codon:yes gene_type:complete